MDTSQPLETRLTAQEHAQWLMAEVQPDDTRYNIGQAMAIAGFLDLKALRFAWQRLVAGHDILRTTYDRGRSGPTAVCHAELDVPVAFIDGQGLDDAAIQARIDSWFDTPFELRYGPCLRLGCFARGAHAHVLVLCTHHVIADFTSLGLMLDELESLYLCETGSEVEHWRNTPVPFDEYRRRAHGAGDSSVGCEQTYWHRYLGQVPAPLDWPNYWRQGIAAGGSHYLDIDGERLRGLRRLAEEQQSSLYAVILATWATAVARACAQEQVMVGIPMSMRDTTFAHTLGSLFNVLPLCVRPAQAWHDLIGAIRADLHAALDNRGFDLVAVVDALGVPRPEGRNPLFQTTVNMLGRVEHSRWLALQMAGPQACAQWAGLRIAPWPLAQQQGQVDIALELVDAHDSLRCVIKGDLRSFSTTGLERFAAHWLGVVDALLGEQAVCGDAHHIAWQSDYNRVPGPLNSEPVQNARQPSLVAWFDAHAAHDPYAAALRDQDGELDYRTVQARSVRLARQLAEFGVTPGDRVGVLLAPGIEAVVAMLAAMRAGAAYVPLDPNLPPERLAMIVRQSAISLVVTEEPLPWRDEYGVRCCPVAGIGLEQVQGPLFDLSAPGTCAYSVFTSGSTGQPKGINVAQHNVIALLETMFTTLQMPQCLVWSWSHAASFDLSIWEIWGALCSGGCLLVIPQAVRSRPDQLLEWLVQHQVDVITQTPSGLRQLSADLPRHLAQLAARHWIVCGEALPGATARCFLSERWALWNLYGPAETTVFASIERVTPALAQEVIVPIGRPLPFATLYLLNDEACPAIGGVGEIVIGGAGVSLGYVGLAQHNRERFIVDPYRGDAIAYRTGDLGYWDGERLRFAGRLDEQVKFNGYRIELGEIECCLETHAQVRQAAALLEEVAGHARLVVLVQCHDTAIGFDEKVLREHLLRRLPAYMQPTRLLEVAQVPLSRHAKLDRKAVGELFEAIDAAPAPSSADSDDWRERIRTIWAQVLGRSQVGLDDAFFDLGGNSMALLQVHGRLQQWPEGRQLRPSDLFRWVTPRTLAEALQAQGHLASAPLLEPERRRDTLLRRRQRPGMQIVKGGRHE